MINESLNCNRCHENGISLNFTLNNNTIGAFGSRVCQCYFNCTYSTFERTDSIVVVLVSFESIAIISENNYYSVSQKKTF